MALPGIPVIPSVDSPGTRALRGIEPTRPITPLGDTGQESSDRLARLEVGKQFQGQILSRFNDGTFMVRIADTSARIALPGGSQVGDDLLLTLLGTDPRATFNLDSRTAGAGLTQDARNAQALYLSNATSQKPVLPAEAGVGGGAAPADLSPAGKLIADLLGAARDAGAATALVGKTPLASSAGAGAPQLATALHDTLSASGLFYESHVYQWANGQRPLTDLLREPQAKGSRPATGDGAAQITPSTDLSPAVLETRRNLLDYFGAAPLPMADRNAAGSLDPAAAQMINLQLNTLEQQRVQWQGELWPGQKLQWEVSRNDQPGQPASDDPAQQQWQSVVRFSLPSLGMVSATISLAGDRVQIQVSTASEETAAALRQYGPKLASALDVAGTALDNLIIRREEPTDGAT